MTEGQSQYQRPWHLACCNMYCLKALSCWAWFPSTYMLIYIAPEQAPDILLSKKFKEYVIER